MDDSDSQTVPLDSTYRALVVHNNREFQQYALENGAYFAPVDDDEVERLHIMDAVFNRMFDNRLIFPPVPNPRRILECGFGSASWAVNVAVEFPDCEVVGIDIFPYPVPDDLPANLDLQIDDLNRPSTFPSNHFDLVHSRMMSGAIHADRWQHYLRDLLRVLRPGGWCQMAEIYFNVQSDNGTLTENHALQIWSQNYMQSLQPYKDPRAPLRLQNWMTQAGFVEVEARLLTLPLSGWSNDPRERAIGMANRQNTHQLLSSLATYPFTQHLGMTNENVELLVAQARNEADNPAYKAYVPVYVCIGRKPTSSKHQSRQGDSRKSHHGSSSSSKHGESRKRVKH